MVKTKMYKPGQLLTINHRKYRVKRARSCTGVCHYCDAHDECLALDVGTILCVAAPADCYLQLIKPKSSLG